MRTRTGSWPSGSRWPEHYKDAPPSILFELLNEPNGKLDATRWNSLLARALAVVRATNPRADGLSSGQCNGTASACWTSSSCPRDDHLLVTVSLLRPVPLLRIRAPNGPRAAPPGSARRGAPTRDKKAITDSFDKAAKWGVGPSSPDVPRRVRRVQQEPDRRPARDGRPSSRGRRSRTAFRGPTGNSAPASASYDPVAKQWRKPLLDALLPQPVERFQSYCSQPERLIIAIA